MAKNHKTKKADSHLDHIHLWDIPKKYFPKKTRAKMYRSDILNLVGGLAYTNKLLQYSGMIAIFNIGAIYQDKGYVAKPSEVFSRIEDFVYHFENYCFRTFAFREKILQFINAILPIGYTEKQVKIEHIIINPIAKNAKLIPLIEKFSKSTSALCELIKDRHQLTHRVYYGDKFDNFLRPNQEVNKESFKPWLISWQKEISKRIKQVRKAEYEISEICNHLAGKIMSYKDSLN